MRGEKRYSVVMDSTMMSGRQEIVLNHRDDHLSIAFSGAGYESCMQVVYQYKMMGYDDQWTTRQQPGSITYANLPAERLSFPSESFANASRQRAWRAKPYHPCKAGTCRLYSCRRAIRFPRFGFGNLYQPPLP